MEEKDGGGAAWGRPRRGKDRVEIEIQGSRVWVGCRGGMVRVVITRARGASQVETDLVEAVEVHTWARASRGTETRQQAPESRRPSSPIALFRSGSKATTPGNSS